MNRRDGLPEWYRAGVDEEPAPSILSLAVVALLLAAGAWVWIVGFVTVIGWIL